MLAILLVLILGRPLQYHVVRHLQRSLHLCSITGTSPHLEPLLRTAGDMTGPPGESLQLGSRYASGGRYERQSDAEQLAGITTGSLYDSALEYSDGKTTLIGPDQSTNAWYTSTLEC